MDKNWFEMNKEIKRNFSESVWIPLFVAETISKVKEYGDLGYVDEYFGVGSVFIPEEDFKRVYELGWEDIGRYSISRSYSDDGVYHPCDQLNDFTTGIKGIRPVLVQEIPNYPLNTCHIHQDIIIALNLVKEDDSWVAPDEDFTEVIKITLDSKGNTTKLVMKNDFLKDYLCARRMGLYLSSFRERRQIVDTSPEFGWLSGRSRIEKEHYIWSGMINPIHEGGEPFGTSTLVMHLERTDIDVEDDVPILGLPTDKNIKSEEMVFKSTGEKFFFVRGELWKNELILPGTVSERINGDEGQNPPFFYIDASGNQESQMELKEGGRWLWFDAQIINTLLKKRNGKLKWNSQTLGVVSCSPDYPINFGINVYDLITVYAKDIAYLPIWQQKIWAGFNKKPEGGLPNELFLVQGKGVFVDTQAPEACLVGIYTNLNQLFKKRYGIYLFKEHKDIFSIMQTICRFRSIDEGGLFALAKDVARVFFDSINLSSLKSLLHKPEKWASLRTLQQFLSERIGMDTEDAYKFMSPLFGIYDLRLNDAHLGSQELEVAFQNIGIDKKTSKLTQGYQLIYALVVTIQKLIDHIMNDMSTIDKDL